MLGIVGLQWPEDSDCSQFPEEGGNTTCLLPEDGVDGTDVCYLHDAERDFMFHSKTAKHVIIFCKILMFFLLLFVVRCLGNRVLPQPLQVSVRSLRPGNQTV